MIASFCSGLFNCLVHSTTNGRQSQSYITSDSQSVLVSGTHPGPATNFSHSLYHYFYTLAGLLMRGAHSDEKSRLKFQFLLGVARADFLRPESYGTYEHVPGYGSRGPGPIPSATRLSEKQWVWNGVLSASWVQLRSYLTIEKLLGRKSSGSNLECWEYCSGDLFSCSCDSLYSSTIGGPSVGIVRSRTKATEFLCNMFR
jgi:hypothetical protein